MNHRMRKATLVVLMVSFALTLEGCILLQVLGGLVKGLAGLAGGERTKTAITGIGDAIGGLGDKKKADDAQKKTDDEKKKVEDAQKAKAARDAQLAELDKLVATINAQLKDLMTKIADCKAKCPEADSLEKQRARLQAKLEDANKRLLELREANAGVTAQKGAGAEGKQAKAASSSKDKKDDKLDGK